MYSCNTLPFSCKVYNTPLFTAFCVFAIVGWKAIVDSSEFTFELSVDTMIIYKITPICYQFYFYSSTGAKAYLTAIVMVVLAKIL